MNGTDQDKIARYFDYALKFSMAVMIVLIPFRPIWGSYSLIALATVAFANAVYLRKWEKMPTLSLLLIAMFLVRVLWVLRADDVRYGLKALETELPIIAIPLVFSLFKLTSARKTFAIRMYVLMGIGLMTYAFIQLAIYFQTTSPYTFWDYTMFHLDPEWFWNVSRYFSWNMLNWDSAHYSFITIIIIYGMHLIVYLENKTIYDKILMVAYIIMITLFLIYGGSRVGTICTLIGFLGYGTFAIKALFRNKIVFASLVGVAVIAIFSVLTVWGAKIEPDRHLYATYAIAAIGNHPLLGNGTGSGKNILSDPQIEVKTGEAVNHPHNQFLSEVMQFGIIGCIPFVVFLALALLHSFDFYDRALLSVLVTAIIFMLTESPLNSNKGVFPFVLLVTILFSGEKRVSGVKRI